MLVAVLKKVPVFKKSKRKPSLLDDPFLDKETLSFARQALRRASYRWKPKNEAVKAARVSRGLYKCASCGKMVANKDKEIDHVEPVIRTSGDRQTLGEFAARLFAPIAGWQSSASTATEQSPKSKMLCDAHGEAGPYCTIHCVMQAPMAVDAEKYRNPELTEAVDYPSHYTSHPSGIECIQVTEHMGFNLGNAVKYIWRADLKNDAIEDLQKARWYITRELEKRGSK